MKHLKFTAILMTGILFFALAIIPVTLFSQEKQKDEMVYLKIT